MSAQPNKNTDKNLKDTNEFRQSIGLKPIKPVKRTCLRCEKEFISYSINERMCCLHHFKYPDFIPIV